MQNLSNGLLTNAVSQIYDIKTAYLQSITRIRNGVNMVQLGTNEDDVGPNGAEISNF